MAKPNKDPELEIKAKIKNTDKDKDWSWNSKDKKDKTKSSASSGATGMLYFVGFVGSFIYWWQAAEGLGAYMTGFLKSLVWPAYVVYKLLESFYGVVN